LQTPFFLVYNVHVYFFYVVALDQSSTAFAYNDISLDRQHTKRLLICGILLPLTSSCAHSITVLQLIECSSMPLLGFLSLAASILQGFQLHEPLFSTFYQYKAEVQSF